MTPKHSLALVLVVMGLAGCATPPHRTPVVIPTPPPVIVPAESLFDLNVRVLDARAEGVPGAVVVLETLDARTTDGSGFANFGVREGAHRLDIGAPGFEPQHVDALVSSENLDVSVILARLQTSPSPRPRQVKGRLQARGLAITYPDGALFPWRFATGFRLLEQVAHGRIEEASAFLAWARDPDGDPATPGFTGVRVLTMASGLFTLSPDEGRMALGPLLKLADTHDLYVELVALADTRAYNFSEADCAAQVRAVAGIAAGFDVALVQVANENDHPSQVGLLADPAVIARLAHQVPPGVLYTEAPGTTDEPLVLADGSEVVDPPLGQYITRHLDRGRTPWAEQIRRVREIANVEAVAKRPTVNDEPEGCDEQDGSKTGRQRYADLDAAFALGVLGRVFEVGSTFHFQDGLYARVPAPNQQACALAFLDGATLWPDDLALRFLNATWAGSPVVNARFGTTVVRVYSGVQGARGFAVAVGVTGDPGIQWGNGWRPTSELRHRPGVIVYAISSAP